MEDDRGIWIVFGRQDREMWVTQVDKKQLYESLIPIDLSKKPQDHYWPAPEGALSDIYSS